MLLEAIKKPMIDATNYYYLIKQAKPILDTNRQEKEIYLANISWKLNNKPIIKKKRSNQRITKKLI